jgi:hypothetical protein
VLFFETRTLVCISRNHEVNLCFKEPSRELDHTSRNQGILFCSKESGNRYLYKKKQRDGIYRLRKIREQVLFPGARGLVGQPS